VVAIDAESEKPLAAAQARVEEMLTEKKQEASSEGARPSSLSSAIDSLPGANLALISVPGEYAAREARQALRKNLHVMLFSDNVSLKDEIALKKEAVGRNLLMMGPDCGTAIINGVPLGFANAVRRGSIGIVGASGTGIQAISSLVDRYGGGISQAIGTGGRDLHEEVGGLMALFGIDALASDPETSVIVVVSKAPAQSVAERVIAKLEKLDKPVVAQFIGEGKLPPCGSITFAPTKVRRAKHKLKRLLPRSQEG